VNPNNTSIISIDPGNSGAITFLSQGTTTIRDIPIISYVSKSGKAKKKYNLPELKNILTSIKVENLVAVLEEVGTQQGEGNVSAFNFGRGIGNLEGLIVGCLNTEPLYVLPQTWKKHFPELVSDEMKTLKAQEKELKLKLKTQKTEKDASAMKKEISKVKRQYKALSKSSARVLAAKLKPELAEHFKLVKHDGRAESLLIGIYTLEKLLSK
jgi:hypothetical protein